MRLLAKAADNDDNVVWGGHGNILLKLVGWAKRPDANASGGVPTISVSEFEVKMVGTARRRAFAHPTGFTPPPSASPTAPHRCAARVSVHPSADTGARHRTRWEARRRSAQYPA